jgi:hypothetical protein
VLQLTLMGLAIKSWIDFGVINPASKFIDDLDSQALSTQDLNTFTQVRLTELEQAQAELVLLNPLLQAAASTMHAYRIYLAITVFIMTFKMLRYVISLNEKLNNFLQIIINVLEYMFFYLILLASILLAFAILGNFVYYDLIYAFSTISRTMVTLIGMILGDNDNLDDMVNYSPAVTFIYIMMFFFIIVSVMVNMFWVFVKNNLVDFERAAAKQ